MTRIATIETSQEEDAASSEDSYAYESGPEEEEDEKGTGARRAARTISVVVDRTDGIRDPAQHPHQLNESHTQHDRYGTVIIRNDFQYTRARVSSKKITYRCSIYRRTGCKGKVEFNLLSSIFSNPVSHTCRDDAVTADVIIDVTSQMEAYVDELAISDLSTTAQRVWDINVYYEGNTLHRLIAWAHPRLLELLLYPNSSIFVDGTFRSVPRPFRQCLVVMVDDPASRVFVPVKYILATGILGIAYRKTFLLVADSTEQRLRLSRVVCDFEQALIDSIGAQFPTARIVGCMFHFKQAIRRRMIKLRLSNNIIALAMETGMLDMLTVISPEHVVPHGIAFVTRKIRQECLARNLDYSDSKWTTFWNYFRRTWVRRFPVDLWNVHGMDLSIVSRTNNPLERFNRELNASITSPHPNLPVFVGVIDMLSRRYVQLLTDISQRRATAPARYEIRLPTPVNVLPSGSQRGRRAGRFSATEAPTRTERSDQTRRTRRTQ
ncbi:hypothetical protein ON010_g18074 [Phytophthora cinnamomi]|nr:hypothetical protein ON010_g18074 [Phytophthora cinnamomi]